MFKTLRKFKLYAIKINPASKLVKNCLLEKKRIFPLIKNQVYENIDDIPKNKIERKTKLVARQV